MNICVYGASSDQLDPSYIQAVEELGSAMAKRGHALVFGAGGQGLMGAVARGMDRENGSIIGIVPTFFDVDGILFDHCSELIRPETMRQRKQLMEERSDAFIMVPGGIGTFDEFFEMLTLRQLGRHVKPMTVLNVNGYFDSLFAFLQTAADEHFLTPNTLDLYRVFKNPEHLLDFLESYQPEEVDIHQVKHV